MKIEKLIELQCEILAESVNIIDVDPKTVMDKPYSEDYYKLAMAIVEPKGPEEVLEDYHNFMENDPQNWKGFVINTIGDDYIPIIDFILENGY